MQRILNDLKYQTVRSSTKSTYLSVWRKFNSFLIKLDRRPNTWEDRITLFGVYLITNGCQSSTLRSYYSAIKAILRSDDYEVDDKKVLLASLVKSCKLRNDHVRTRLPIQSKLLEILLFEVQQMYHDQPYLDIMYKTILLLGYYRLLRIGELTTGEHPIKAVDVHVGQNKNKLLFTPRSSKTHSTGSRPQRIKITSNRDCDQKFTKFFCPFRASHEYLAIRGNYKTDKDPFFVFRDNAPITPNHMHKVLRKALKVVDLDPSLYNCHSLRIGRACDMAKYYSIDFIRISGRWQSNVVYSYIRNIQ